MKNITKAKTKKLVQNAVNHVADGHDVNEVIKNQEKISPAETITVNKEAIETARFGVETAEHDIETAKYVIETAEHDIGAVRNSVETIQQDVETIKSGIGYAPQDDGGASFNQNATEKGVPVVCNINGINVGDECRIECAPNPKRPGSKAHERYATYAESKTVKEYLDNGGLKADLRYDHTKGFLKVLDVIREGKIIEVEEK